MFRSVTLFLWLVAAIILQFTVLPSYLEDPFKPNLLLILVAYLALRADYPFVSAFIAYIIGLIHGSFSGIYFGLAGITMLLIYLLLRAIADQLYAESANLMIVAVLAGSVIDALLSLLLLALFSSDASSYNSFLANMIPQAAITAFTAFLIFTAVPLLRRRLSF